MAVDSAGAEVAHAVVVPVPEVVTKAVGAIKVTAKGASAVARPTDVTAKSLGDVIRPIVLPVRKDTNLYYT